ncbi:MAG TPA: alanine racemase [Gaiellaceae bacterium]|nr:alanine racemase [Gaiellaceae bacterium]
MRRSEITIDLAALRRNVRRLRQAAGDAELWAVVKADAYGHGAADVAGAALEAGAAALCVATVAEGEALRRLDPAARILVMGPLEVGEDGTARHNRLEVTAHGPDIPSGLPVHLKVDTGMGRWGMSPEEALAAPRDGVVGLMSHLATADEEDEGFVREQLERYRALAGRFDGVIRHVANSAAALRFPEARYDAVRCGVALYGLSPFGDDPAVHGLEPVLSWRSHVALVKKLAPGESTGYGRRFVAEGTARIGLVPVGYGDGFRRGLTGNEVLVGDTRRRIVGTISMDALAVELGDEPEGTEVTLIGNGILVEEHARRLGTINYEVTCGIRSAAERAERRIVDG